MGYLSPRVCVCVVSSLTVCFIVNLHKLVVCLVLFKLNLKTGLEVRNNRRKLTRTWLACVCVCVYTHYLCKCVCVSVCVRQLTAVYQQATSNNNNNGSTIKITCLFSPLQPSISVSSTLPLSLPLALSVCLISF